MFNCMGSLGPGLGSMFCEFAVLRFWDTGVEGLRCLGFSKFGMPIMSGRPSPKVSQPPEAEPNTKPYACPSLCLTLCDSNTSVRWPATYHPYILHPQGHPILRNAMLPNYPLFHPQTKLPRKCARCLVSAHPIHVWQGSSRA